MKGKRNPFVAGEGLPFLIITAAVIGLLLQFGFPWYASIPALLLVWLTLIFRDPHRTIPAVPLGVVSPVDGTVVKIAKLQSGYLGVEAHSITIRVGQALIKAQFRTVRLTISTLLGGHSFTTLTKFCVF